MAAGSTAQSTMVLLICTDTTLTLRIGQCRDSFILPCSSPNASLGFFAVLRGAEHAFWYGKYVWKAVALIIDAKSAAVTPTH